MYFRSYGLRKAWSNKSLKGHLSEGPSGSNMAGGPNTNEI